MSLDEAIERVRLATGERLREGADMASIASQLMELTAGLHHLDGVIAGTAQAPASAIEPATIFRRSTQEDRNKADER